MPLPCKRLSRKSPVSFRLVACQRETYVLAVCQRCAGHFNSCDPSRPQRSMLQHTPACSVSVIRSQRAIADRLLACCSPLCTCLLTLLDRVPGELATVISTCYSTVRPDLCEFLAQQLRFWQKDLKVAYRLSMVLGRVQELAITYTDISWPEGFTSVARLVPRGLMTVRLCTRQIHLLTVALCSLLLLACAPPMARQVCA